MKRKSIVLSGTEGEVAKKAVLTLEESDGGLEGTIRLYNFSREPNGILSLGLFSGQKVYKAGLVRKSQMLYNFFLNVSQIPQKFSCAVVNFQNAEPKPVLYGSSEGCADDVYATVISEVAGTSSFQKTQEVLDKYGVDFDEPEKKEIEKEIDDSICNENCATCIYKKYFYENQHDAQIANYAESSKAKGSDEKQSNLRTERGFGESSERAFDKNDTDDAPNLQNNPAAEAGNIVFFERLKPQIDKLFESNPAENNLQNMFPSSKWAKVEYEDEGDFFVFGLLYDEAGNVKYVCYGVPSVFDENPPEELDGYPVWLPLDDKQGFGYWMTYQDAVTGEPIKAIID